MLNVIRNKINMKKILITLILFLTSSCTYKGAIKMSGASDSPEMNTITLNASSSNETVELTKVTSPSSTDPNQYIYTNKTDVPVSVSAVNANKVAVFSSATNCFSDDSNLFTWMNIEGMPNLVVSDNSELGPLQRKFYFRLLHSSGKSMSPCYVLGFNIDKVAPTVVIGSPSPATSTTAGGTISFAVSTTEISLTSLSASQVTLGGTATGCNKSVTGSAPNFSIEISGCSGAGTVNVTLPAGLTTDSAGNSSIAVSSTNATITSPLPTGKIMDFDAAQGNGTAFGGIGCPTILNTFTNLGSGSTLSNGTMGMFTNSCSGSNGGWRGTGTTTDPYRMEFRNPTYNYAAGGYLASDSAPGIYVSASTEADHLSKRTSGSLEMWIRQDIAMPNSDASYMTLYMDSWVPGTNSPTWGFTLTGSGRLALSTYRSGSWYGQYSTGSYSFGSTTWRQVAVTWSGTSVKYYIDGLIDSTINYGVPLTTTNTPLGQATIAKNQWWSNPFSGSIARVRAFNSQISDAHIAALCREMAPRFSGFSCR